MFPIKILSANIIKAHILDFYMAEWKKIKEILQEVPGQISFTTDIWTSPATKTFLIITAHFIDKKWKLQSLIIDFIQIWGAHTGENIRKVFIEGLENFSIQTKVSLFFYFILFKYI